MKGRLVRRECLLLQHYNYIEKILNALYYLGPNIFCAFFCVDPYTSKNLWRAALLDHFEGKLTLDRLLALLVGVELDFGGDFSLGDVALAATGRFRMAIWSEANRHTASVSATRALKR